MKLPSKKVVVVSLVGVVIIVAVLLVVKQKQSTKEDIARDNIVARAPNIEDAASIDTDNDGLRDWEEILWNTDPQKSDTDGDGTKDGEETRANRNPTNSTKDDALPEEEEVVGPINVTEEFAKSAFAKYLSNESTSNEQILEGTKVAGNIALYTDRDLKITSDNSEEALAQFSKTWWETINKYSYYKAQEEEDLLKRALETKRPEDIEAVRRAADVYKRISDDLRAIPVPQQMVKIDLAFINAFYGMHQSVLQMSQALEDPIVGLMGLKNADDHMTLIITLFLYIEKAAQYS